MSFCLRCFGCGDGSSPWRLAVGDDEIVNVARSRRQRKALCEAVVPIVHVNDERCKLLVVS